LLWKTEERAIGVSVPVPLSARLDRLVELIEQQGHRVYRKDLVAALLLAASEDPAELADLITRYRTAEVSAAAVGGSAGGDVVELSRAKPGPRPRRR